MDLHLNPHLAPHLHCFRIHTERKETQSYEALHLENAQKYELGDFQYILVTFYIYI